LYVELSLSATDKSLKLEGGEGGGVRVPLPIRGYSSLNLSHLRTAFYYNDLTILDIWDTIIMILLYLTYGTP